MPFEGEAAGHDKRIVDAKTAVQPDRRNAVGMGEIDRCLNGGRRVGFSRRIGTIGCIGDPYFLRQPPTDAGSPIVGGMGKPPTRPEMVDMVLDAAATFDRDGMRQRRGRTRRRWFGGAKLL